MLLSIDFVSPVAAIRSAEAEMARVRLGRTRDMAEIEKIQEAIRIQKQRLSELKKHWLALSSELRSTALSVREGLAKTEKTCDSSISILSDCEIARKRERQRIEDIKTYFKTQLKNDLYGRQVTWRDLEKAKREFDLLSRQISTLGREDIFALTELYSAIRSHAAQTGKEIDALLQEVETKKDGSVRENKELFKLLGDTLVKHLSCCRFELKAAEHQDVSADASVIRVIRKELLDYLFEVVQEERRSQRNRRSTPDRRKFNDPRYKGRERRSSTDRRITKSRKTLAG